jgi:hypothetical protein
VGQPGKTNIVSTRANADLRAGFMRQPALIRRLTMGILGFIVLGLIVGALAKLIMPGSDPGARRCSAVGSPISSTCAPGYSPWSDR